MTRIEQYHRDTNTTYVYESESYWDKEKKQSRSRRRLIGKIDPETGEIVPTGKRGRKKKAAPQPIAGATDGELKRIFDLYEQATRTIALKNRTISSQRSEIASIKEELALLREQNKAYRNAISKISAISVSLSEQ